MSVLGGGSGKPPVFGPGGTPLASRPPPVSGPNNFKTPPPYLAVALDFDTREECLAFVPKLDGLPVVLKLGLRLLPLMARDDFAALRKRGFRLFIDVKLHDIPSQVGGAVKTWGELGADMLTVHLGGGTAMLQEAAKAAESSSTRVLGVSVLTSLGAKDLTGMGVIRSLQEQVRGLVQLGLNSGVRGFVCSVAEAGLVQKTGQQLGLQPFVVTPGLRLENEPPAADQQRSFTVNEALKEGSHLLVVGRSILKAADPRAATEKILALFPHPR